VNKEPDEPWTGGIDSHTTDDPHFYVALDGTIAQYIRSADGKTGHGFSFLCIDFTDEDEVGQHVVSLALLDDTVLPRLLRELIENLPCDELTKELLTTLDNHKHKDEPT